MIAVRPNPPSDTPSTLGRACGLRAGLPALCHLRGVREGALSSQRGPGWADAGLASRPHRPEA